MDYKKFLSKYFAGERQAEIPRNIRPEQYKRLSEGLSPSQLAVISDNTSKYIVVSAGPGSGKTKILVHKPASLLLLEDVKHEQQLMLTFSRAAATEFQTRLRELIQARRIVWKSKPSIPIVLICLEGLAKTRGRTTSNSTISRKYVSFCGKSIKTPTPHPNR